MIVLVFGSRPEAIKLGPLAAELDALGTPWRAVCTGQHTTLLKGTPAESDLARCTNLGMASDGKVLAWLNKATRALRGAVHDASMVVVQGDTMSAMAGARAAHDLGIPVAHVEAGIRSYADEPWPEEAFRSEIDALATWMYAPTSHCFANLASEGYAIEHIRVTGNTVVDALARYSDATPRRPQEHCLITLHRREWIEGPHFVDVLDALQAAAQDHPAATFYWPIHPNVQKRLGSKTLAGGKLHIVQPMPYRDATLLLASAFGVLTDSGGLQEEAATLGVPCAVLRNVLDRPESVEAGVARQFDVNGDGVRAAIAALCGAGMPRRPTTAFGAPGAALAIAQHLDSLTLRE